MPNFITKETFSCSIDFANELPGMEVSHELFVKYLSPNSEKSIRNRNMKAQPSLCSNTDYISEPFASLKKKIDYFIFFLNRIFL